MKIFDVSTKTHQGIFAKVDDEDFEWVKKFHWLACRCGKSRTLYVVRSSRVGGKCKMIYLHREVIRAKPGQHVDHIDRDGTNNTKENLRLCTIAENMRNSDKIGRDGCTSKFKGVGYDKRKGLYRCRIRDGQRYVWIGYFRSEVDAAKAYNDAAIRLHKNFARLNEI